MLTSVIDIKTLIVKLAGYYENKLRVSSSISFFFSRLYNSMNQDDNSNSFPLLTNLVQKIYKNFGFHKTKEECNNFIKKYIKEYFRLAPIKEEQNDDDKGGLRNEFSKYNFYRDLYILGNLFWNSDLNYKIDETIEKDWLVEDDNIDEDKDKKNNKNNNDDKKEKENNEKELKEKIFHVNEDDEEDDIEKEKLLSYVKKNFGLIKEEVELTPKQKMKIKLFYISYIANELINNICISLNKKGNIDNQKLKKDFQKSQEYKNNICNFPTINSNRIKKVNEKPTQNLHYSSNNKTLPTIANGNNNLNKRYYKEVLLKKNANLIKKTKKIEKEKKLEKKDIMSDSGSGSRSGESENEGSVIG